MRIILILLCLLPISARAQQAKEPVEIEAAGSLVWQQSDKTYRAVGDAVATRGQMQVRADELIAHYADQGGSNEIQSIEAKGNVRINNAGSKASGPYGKYDMSSGDVILQGENLSLTSESGDTLTAQQEIRFNDKTGKAFAIGKPFIMRLDRTLAAERVDAQFVRSAEGDWVIQTATAQQNVVITTGIGTPEPSVASGDQGVYDAAKNSALLTGNVKIKKGQNQLNGERAEIDMASGIARLLPGANNTGRVKALLYQK